MRVFLSSTFLDLFEEREAVLDALQKKHAMSLAMEHFLATPSTPREAALENLRNSDVMLLVIGFKAGTLLPDGSGSTYTSAEYDECVRLRKDVLVFIKKEKLPGQAIATWHNSEEDPAKNAALEKFKELASEGSTPAYFTTPDRLALDVILSLDQWEARGRPGARKTFSSLSDYFQGKNPVGKVQLLHFDTTLLGRESYLEALNQFLDNDGQRVSILTGRGGIGKSKILHDWSTSIADKVVFLKDEPLWHEDSDKEIPIACKVVIVDDAHRQERFGKVLQFLQDSDAVRKLKLIVATRPGSATRVFQDVVRKIDASEILQLPELKELTKKQSHALAQEVLGAEFNNYAAHLAEVGSNSPLVIVAGGRLISKRKINPSALTTLEEFRSTVFNRLLDEMDLRGSRFVIDPPLPVLHLIAALGPVIVEAREFQEAASNFLGKHIDEILKTIEALAVVGIVTPRPKPVRVLPDVLSDYLLEQQCIDSAGLPTLYADRVYQQFGAHSLKSLMRNLAELDWRRGQSGETGLRLLDGIWGDIQQRFRAGDEYVRHEILNDIAGAAIYQPDQVIALVRTAIDDPVQLGTDDQGSRFRAGQEYVLSAIPALLEATAYHPERLMESVITLWELTKYPSTRSGPVEGAKAALKRLASWHRFGNPAFTFAVLVEAIRLTKRDDALTSEFTPFTLIRQMLEREGEFNEWQDETTLSFGGFGLNYAAVGPVRESALDYLEHVLEEGKDVLAIQAVRIFEDLLHSYLNRIVRESSEEEKIWQNRERERGLGALLRRYNSPASAILRARIYNALRSATGVNCPEPIRGIATAALADIKTDDDVVVVDAICTDLHNLPLSSTDLTEAGWERPITELMMNGRSSLDRLVSDPGNQARFTIDRLQACIEVRVKTAGFHRFMMTFADRPDFLSEMADQLLAHGRLEELAGHLSSVLNSIHFADPRAFRERALSALKSGALQVIRAAATNLRVFDDATEEDVAVIQAYAGYPDPVAKRGAIFAITYMGKFVELRSSLKEAVLSIRTEGDPTIAADLADAFGPYGVPLTTLTREEAAKIASEFLFVRDWDFQQGAIPRFLSGFVSLFPDETYNLLLRRIDESEGARKRGETWFRSFHLAHVDISFGSVPAEKRIALGRDCIGRLIVAEIADELSGLFWDVAGYEEKSLRTIVDVAPNANDRAVRNIAVLITKAVPRLAFTNVEFVRDLLKNFSGERRQKLVEAFAYQAGSYGFGGVYAGNPEDMMAQQQKRFAEQTASFPDEPGLEDLAKALRRRA